MITLCCLVIDFFAPTNRHGSMFMFIHWMLHCQFDGVEYSSLNILGCDFIISRCLMNSCRSLLLSLLLFRAYHQIIMKTTFFHSTRFFIYCMWVVSEIFFTPFDYFLLNVRTYRKVSIFVNSISSHCCTYKHSSKQKVKIFDNNSTHFNTGGENNREKEMQMVKIIKKAANMMFA